MWAPGFGFGNRWGCVWHVHDGSRSPSNSAFPGARTTQTQAARGWGETQTLKAESPQIWTFISGYTRLPSEVSREPQQTSWVLSGPGAPHGLCMRTSHAEPNRLPLPGRVVAWGFFHGTHSPCIFWGLLQHFWSSVFPLVQCRC